jgi:hypothetical protein
MPASAYPLAMSDRNFGDVVLVLLFLSCLGLVWSSIR